MRGTGTENSVGIEGGSTGSLPEVKQLWGLSSVSETTSGRSRGSLDGRGGLCDLFVEAGHVLLAKDKIGRSQHSVLVVRGALGPEHIGLLVLRGRRHAGLSSPSLFKISAVWLFQIIQHVNFEAGDGGG